jgi:hypothetical protein
MPEGTEMEFQGPIHYLERTELPSSRYDTVRPVKFHSIEGMTNFPDRIEIFPAGVSGSISQMTMKLSWRARAFTAIVVAIR